MKSSSLASSNLLDSNLATYYICNRRRVTHATTISAPTKASGMQFDRTRPSSSYISRVKAPPSVPCTCHSCGSCSRRQQSGPGSTVSQPSYFNQQTLVTSSSRHSTFANSSFARRIASRSVHVTPECPPIPVPARRYRADVQMHEHCWGDARLPRSRRYRLVARSPSFCNGWSREKGVRGATPHVTAGCFARGLGRGRPSRGRNGAPNAAVMPRTT